MPRKVMYLTGIDQHQRGAEIDHKLRYIRERIIHKHATKRIGHTRVMGRYRDKSGAKQSDLRKHK
jgi:hypothetical protein